MNIKIYITIIAIVLIAFLVLYKERTKQLGKAKVKRPPKVRIVYSKKQKTEERPKITSSDGAVSVLREIWSSQIEVREEFVVLLLDRANRVLGYQLVSKGGMSGTIADVKLIYSVALESLASGIIIAHNHPSGNTQPSQADIQLTKKISEAGKQLDIILLDHIILTKESYYSLADEGLM